MQDSFYSQERLKTVQNMTFEENTRQMELAAQKKKDKESKRKNLEPIVAALE